MESIATMQKAGKVYQVGDNRIVALQPTDMELKMGELLLIIGPSGSGKTTLLSMLGCVVYPSEGKLWVNGQEVTNLSQRKLAALRLNTIGFVFQNFNLLAPLTAEENIQMPLRLMGLPNKVVKARAEEAMEFVGMTDRRYNLPKALSGGQQQRIAIARALVNNPKMILCDEPTASLDKDSIEVIMGELRSLAEKGRAVAVVTHDPRLKPYAHRIVEVRNGEVFPVDNFEA